MQPAPEIPPVDAGPLWLPPEPDLPEWVQADPRTRLQEVVRGLTEEDTFVLAALTTFDVDAGAWRLAALSVADSAPELKARVEQAAVLGTSMRLDSTPARNSTRSVLAAAPDMQISRQLADLLDPIVRAGPTPGAAAGVTVRLWTTVPLWVGDRLLGALMAGAVQAELGEAQQELMQAFAGQAILALANITLWERAYESLRRSRDAERRYRNLLESSVDAIFLIDPEGRFTYLNRQAEAMVGYSRDELIGQSFWRLASGKHREALHTISQRIRQGESLPFTLDVALITKLGKETPAEISLTSLRSGGALSGVQVIARDIRERLSHEQEREQLLTQSEAMGRRLRVSFGQIGAALAHSRDLDAALSLIARFAAQLLDADQTMLWLLEPEGYWLSLAALNRDGSDLVEKPTAGNRWKVGEGFIGRVVSESRALRVVGPPQTLDAWVSDDDAVPGDDVLACLGVPLMAYERVLGALVVTRRRPAPFTDAELELLTSFAHQASIAIEQAQLFEHLYQKGSECETIVRSSADGILVLNQEQRVIDFNPALLSMLGYTAEQLIGKCCWEVVHNTSENGSHCGDECPFHPRRAGDSTLLFTHQLQRADGRLITVSVSYGIVRDSEGRITRVIATIRDVSKQAELDRLRSDFVGSVSHELRTPLALIKGYVGTLLRPDLAVSPEVEARFLHNIDGAADRLGRLIDDLLTVSRIEAGKMAMDLKRHDLVALARDVVEHARVQFPKQQITAELPAGPLYVLMDAGRIEQVLTNLISNGVKFSPDDTPLLVKVERVGEVVRAAVADYGAGIPAEHQDHLFEKFYRVETGLTRQVPGLGLGLNIAKGIVDAHGGHIWVKSKPGAGSTFGFDLNLMAGA